MLFLVKGADGALLLSTPTYAEALSLTKTTPGAVIEKDAGGDPNWRERERGRLMFGAYTPVPWFDDGRLTMPTDHFTHISTDDPTQIAFTENEEKGRQDRQARMRPGRYLERYFPNLDADTVRAYATEIGAPAETFRVASTPAEIERVYEHGPRSCMSKSLGKYASKVHPVTVYGEPGDLRLAYLGDSHDATARALIWPERKLYGRVYGDEHRLMRMLEAAQYRRGELHGARLRLIEQRNGYVCPYIDDTGAVRVSDDGKWLEICSGGRLDRIDATNTNGLAGDASATCPNCGGDMDEDEASYVTDQDEHWCDCCCRDETFYCHGTENRYSYSTNSYEVYGMPGMGTRYAYTVSEQYYNANCFECEQTGDHWHDDHRVELADGSQVCREWFKNNDGYERDGEFYVPNICDPDEPEDTDLDAKPYHSDDPAQLALPIPDPVTPRGNTPIEPCPELLTAGAL